MVAVSDVCSSLLLCDGVVSGVWGFEAGPFVHCVAWLVEPRKLFSLPHDDHQLNISQDHDDDKYKRRPALQWLIRWFK